MATTLYRSHVPVRIFVEDHMDPSLRFGISEDLAMGCIWAENKGRSYGNG